MINISELDEVKRKQKAWAAELQIKFDKDGYCTVLDRNLFQSLSEASRKELASGDGSELGKSGARGKIQAFHSSAALACNFFDYWRGRNLKVLGDAFGLPAPPTRLAFEQKFQTGLGGIPPNMDVVLYEANGRVFGIESKFTEPYNRSKQKCYLKPGYTRDGRLWAEVGLPGCQAVAEDLSNRMLQFEFLDAAQLLKHMLGLGHSPNHWRLCCLWYRLGGSAGDEHQQELEEFTRRIGADADKFTSLTYQEIFKRIKAAIGPEHNKWVSYMENRYFANIAV